MSEPATRWPDVPLGEVAVIERSSVQPSEIAAGTTYVGLENIERGGRFINLKRVDCGELASAKFRFSPSHLLYGKLRPYLAKIACPDFSGICSTDIVPILPRANLERRYLFHYLSQPAMVDYANSRAVGINLPRLAPAVLTQFRIPLPPRAQQRRIAAILDRADHLCVKRRQALTQLDTLSQAIFVDLFGDPATNPKHWRMSTVGNEAAQVTDGEHLTPVRSTEGVKLLSARNIRDGYIDFDNVDFIGRAEHDRIKRRCNPSPGDVLISCSGTIGRVAMVQTTEPFSLVRSVALVRPRPQAIRSKFLEQFLRMPVLKARMLQRANASSQANLFQGQIRELPIAVPPLDLQDEFADRCAAVESLRDTQNAALQDLEALFAALQDCAFRGEL